MKTGWKADLIVRKRRAFSREEFERRVKVELMDVEVWVASAEDTILTKLEWAAAAGSERQIRDAQGVIDVLGGSLDVVYLQKWATELGVTEQLDALLRS